MRRIWMRICFTGMFFSLIVSGISSRAGEDSLAIPPVRDEGNLIWKITPGQEFCVKNEQYEGYHPGEDWNLPGRADLGKPVYAIFKGTVAKLSELRGNRGSLIVIKHDAFVGQKFVIPAWRETSYEYEKEEVGNIYSVYVHIQPEQGIDKGVEVQRGQIIGRIADIAPLSPHLHFEIRKVDSNPSEDWSMVYENDKKESQNWARINRQITGYYKNAQKMVDAGLRHPSDFIKSNSIVSPVWNEYKIGSLYLSVPADWVFIMPQKNGLAAASVMDFKNKKFLNLAIGIEEMSDSFKDAETGKKRIVHYGFEGGKRIEEPGTTSQTMSVGHMGYLIDSFKTKLFGRSVTVCVLRGGGQGITQEGVKKVEHTILSLAFFEKGKHYSIILWGIDLIYQKEIFEKLVSKIRFAS